VGAAAAGPATKVGGEVKCKVKGSGRGRPLYTIEIGGFKVGRRIVPSLFRGPFLLSPLADGVLPVRCTPSWFLPPLRWKFIAFDGSISLPSALENAQGFRALGTAASFPEILFRPQGRNLLCHGYIDELVQGYSFHFRNLSQLLQQRRL
jgi:hypothetical protein